MVSDPARLPQASLHHVITADSAGVVEWCDARSIGVGAMRLGAGRATTTDTIDHAVGIQLQAKQGTNVAAGDDLATVHYNDLARLEDALTILAGAWRIGPGPADIRPLVLETIGP